FNGHITIKPYNSNLSYNSDSISVHQDFYPEFKRVPEISHIQAIAIKSCIIRTAESFSGVFLKGVGADYDVKRFETFILKGKFPDFKHKQISNDVVISEKIANELHLDVDS